MIFITYENFDWEIYLNINKDLNNTNTNIYNKETAWYHWLNYGSIEERALSIYNNTNIHNGRLGNLFFVNMVLHFIAIKYNLKCRYKYFDKFKQLGVCLYVGKYEYPDNIIITDDNFLNIIKSAQYNKTNIIINNENWFQTSEFVTFLNLYFNIPNNKLNIINNNIFKYRYKSNNDLFVHVRLGDMKHRMNNINYYEDILSSAKFSKGYISSDSIKDPLCQKLIDKYSLIIIDKSEIETIMFASTCNIIILSGGTFSWLIGFFSFFSKNVYYPSIDNPWYGNIFKNLNWTSVAL